MAVLALDPHIEITGLDFGGAHGDTRDFDTVQLADRVEPELRNESD